MAGSGDQAERHEQTEKLSRLRKKLGNGIVDALLRERGGIENADKAKLFADVDELLDWMPDKEGMRWPNDEVERLGDEQLLAGNLPHSFTKIAEEVRVFPGSKTDDHALDALLRVGQAVYPVLLSQADRCVAKDEPPYPVRAGQLRTETRADELLRDEGLFPERVKNQAFQGASVFGDYSAVRHLYEPSELITYAAWELCLLRGAWTARDYGAAIAEQLARIREANGGGNAKAPVFLGFAGGKVEAPIEVNGIIVRPYIGGLQSSQLGRGERLEQYRESGFIVEVLRPWQYALARADAKAQMSVDQIDWPALGRLAEAIAVGHAMNSAPEQVKPHEVQNPPDAPLPPILRWAYPADPIHQARSHHFATDWPLGTGDHASPFSETSLRNALSLLQVGEKSFHIAIRRILSGLQPGRRWGDCLVDAVIALEALSGDCKGDVTFRVCALMAQLVAGRGMRQDVRESLKKVYAARSRVVHVGEVPEASDSRDAAVLVALVAVRQLCGPHASLLQEKDRFAALCMDD